MFVAEDVSRHRHVLRLTYAGLLWMCTRKTVWCHASLCVPTATAALKQLHLLLLGSPSLVCCSSSRASLATVEQQLLDVRLPVSITLCAEGCWRWIRTL